MSTAPGMGSIWPFMVAARVAHNAALAPKISATLREDMEKLSAPRAFADAISIPEKPAPSSRAEARTCPPASSTTTARGARDFCRAWARVA